MKVNVIGRQMNVYDDMKELIEKKLAKFDKYFSGNCDATVTMSCKHDDKKLEITVSAANTLFRSEATADTFQTALDLAIDGMERQIRKNKTKLQRRFRSEGLSFPMESMDFDLQEEDTAQLIRTKTFSLKPMSAEEAILQMNLLGHQFFVFNDDQTNKTCVIYARKDGGYGLIVPED